MFRKIHRKALCQSLLFNKETPTEMLSYEFYEQLRKNFSEQFLSEHAGRLLVFLLLLPPLFLL